MRRCPELLSLPRARLLDRTGWPASIVAHVDGCARCTAELAAWREATSLLASDVPELDAAALARVERRLRVAVAPPRATVSPWVWGAAAVAGVAVFGVLLRAPTSRDDDAGTRASVSGEPRVEVAPSGVASGTGGRAPLTVPSLGAPALDPVRAPPVVAEHEPPRAPVVVEASEPAQLRVAAERYAAQVARGDTRAPSPSPAASSSSRAAPSSASASPPPSVQALLARADDARRRRDTRAAIEAYEAVAARADGAAFAEEALLRAARLRADRGERADARALLEQLRVRFPTGALTPERLALEAALDDVKVEPGSSAQ